METEIVIADSNPSRVNGSFHNQKVISIEDLRRERLDAIIIGFKSSQDVYANTKSDLSQYFLCPIIDPDTLFHAYPCIRGWPLLNARSAQQLLEQAESVREGLADGRSRKEYWQYYQWVCRCTTSRPAKGSISDQYFVRDIISLNANEVFADCGAYTGDTLAAFLEFNNGQFLAYYGFEPDKYSFKALNERVRACPSELQSRIHLINSAVSDRKGQQLFISSGSETSSFSIQGGQFVETWDLNSYPFLDTPTFIKVDLEGGDLKAIRGLLAGAKKWRPVLCLAIYHNPKDFLDIPTLMMESLSNYGFYVRSHNDFGLDFVLYCIPNERRS